MRNYCMYCGRRPVADGEAIAVKTLIRYLKKRLKMRENLIGIKSIAERRHARNAEVQEILIDLIGQTGGLTRLGEFNI